MEAGCKSHQAIDSNNPIPAECCPPFQEAAFLERNLFNSPSLDTYSRAVGERHCPALNFLLFLPRALLPPLSTYPFNPALKACTLLSFSLTSDPIHLALLSPKDCKRI